MHQSLPIYSGGLGALAGDILKEASDLALPFVAVGLMYRRGYFRQRIDVTGWQQEFWVPTDPERTPAVLVTEGPERKPLKITVPIGGQRRRRADLAGERRPRPALPARHRAAGEQRRLALDHLAPVRRRPRHAPGAVHAARRRRHHRAARARHRAGRRAHERGPRGAHGARDRARRGGRRGDLRRRARRRARADGVHDAHAGAGGQRHVPARPGARDARPPARPRPASTPTAFLRLGRTNPDDDGEPFGVTQLALRSSRAANGVAKRHGVVSRGDVAGHVARPRRRRRPDQPRDQRRPRPVVGRRADAAPARPPPRRRLGAAAPTTRSVVRRDRRHPRRRAVGRAQRAAQPARRRSSASAACTTASRRGDTREYAETAAQHVRPSTR